MKLCVASLVLHVFAHGAQKHFGLQSFFLGDAHNVVLKKLKDYNLLYSQSNILHEKEVVNPYVLLSQFTRSHLEENMIPLKIANATYYISIDTAILNHPDYDVIPRKGKHYIYYHNIEKLRIQDHDLKKIHPYIQELRFRFLHKKVTAIHYTLVTNLKNIRRFVDNAIGRYGGLHKITKQKSPQDARESITFNFSTPRTSIHITMRKELYYNLTRVEHFPPNSKQYTQQQIKVSLKDRAQESAISQHRISIKKSIISQYQELLRRQIQYIRKSQRKQHEQQKHLEAEEYKLIDQL